MDELKKSIEYRGYYIPIYKNRVNDRNKHRIGNIKDMEEEYWSHTTMFSVSRSNKERADIHGA